MMLRIWFIILLLFPKHIFSQERFVVDPRKDKEKLIYLSEFAHEIKYVKLETTDSSYITKISKVLIDDLYIFIRSPFKDYQRLLMFTKNGEFIRSIGSYGRGPGEYNTVLDFALNKNLKQIFILDPIGRILVYSYSGKYLNSIKLESTPTNILFNDNRLFLIHAWPDYHSNNGYGIKVMPNEKTEKSIYLLNRKWIKYQRGMNTLVFPSYFYGINKDNSVSFFEDKFDTLYNINNKYKVTPELVLSLVNEIPIDLLSNNDYNEATKTHNVQANFMKVNNYIFFTVYTPKPVTAYLYLINKLTGQISKTPITSSHQPIINDLDGGLSFIPQGVATTGILYSFIDCYRIKDSLAKDKSNKLVGNASQNTKFLSQLVQNSQISDNPILILVTVN